MNFPIPVTVIGQSQQFLATARNIGQKLPNLFRQMDRLKLDAAYRGATLRIVEQREHGLDAWSYNSEKDEVSVYPTSPNGRQIERAILSGFGFRFYNKTLGSSAKVTWRRKLVKPNRNAVEKLQSLLRTKQKPKLADYVDEFKGATDRLVAIHLLNALIKNNITASRVKTIDLKTFPGTTEFARGLRPFSLIPLLSVYGGKYWGLDRYENAFAEFCISDGKLTLPERSTAQAALALFQAVTFNA